MIFTSDTEVSILQKEKASLYKTPEHSWHTIPCYLPELFLNDENCVWSSSPRHWFPKHKASERVLCITNFQPCYEICSPRSFWHKGNLFLKESLAGYV